MPIPRSLIVGAGAAMAAAWLAVPASAQFYKGKTLNVIINYGAGGNTDIQGRSVLRFMKNHIAGNPRIVVKNMPGAGGVVATNYIVEAAKRDGSVMGIFTIAFSAELMNDKALRVSHRSLNLIGAIGQQQIAHIRKDTAPGLNGARDFVKIDRMFKTAGHAPNSSKDITIKITLGLLGIKHQHVTGYKSSGVIRRALLQNGVQYTEDSVTGYYARVVPALVKPGISIPLWHYGVPTADGGIEREPSMDPAIPTFLDVYKMKYGKDAMPSGLPWKAYLKMAQSRKALRILIMPPEVPKEALSALREAWATTTKDEGYLAEYRKQNASDLVPLIGDEAQTVVSEMVAVDPVLRTYLKEVADDIAASR